LGCGRPGVFANSTSSRLRRELEDSLRRLRTDFIDLYQVHWPDPLVPIAETAGQLAELWVRARWARWREQFNVTQMEEFRTVAPLARISHLTTYSNGRLTLSPAVVRKEPGRRVEL